MEKTPIDAPTPIDIPNEITLAQLVTFYILPAGGDWDVSTVFYWYPEEIEDKGKRVAVEIPYNIPTGFVLRVKANTLRDGQDKKMAKCIYQSVPMCFMISPRANVGQLKARAIDWMVQRKFGADWKLENADNDDEAIDFDYVYPVVPAIVDPQITIFLRQRPVDVSPSESWINVSDRIVRSLGLPLGTLFRIFPVIGDVQDKDPDDGSYSIAWEDNKQYWYDIVCEEGKERRGHAKEIRIVGAFNRVDTLVVPTNANIHEIVEIWKRVLEIPEDIQIEARRGNGTDSFWGYQSAKDVVPYTLRTTNMHGDPQVFPGPENFKADQIGRILGVKVPPFLHCQITPRLNDGEILVYDGEVPPSVFVS
jgi:hypothetical protein